MQEMTQLILPEVREALHGSDEKAVAGAVEALVSELLAADVADLLFTLEHDDAIKLFRALPPSKRIHAFEHLGVEEQEKLVETLGADTLGAVLDGMSSDDRADLFRHLPEAARERLYPMLAQAERNDVKRLLEFKEGTAGSVMSTEYATIKPEMTVSEALEHLRHVAPQRETIYVLFVVDEGRHLVGVASLRQLITAVAGSKVSQVMRREVISAKAGADREEVAALISKYDFLALPILDDEGRMLGIVTHDDVIDVIKAEATEDAQKVGGVEALDMPYLETPVLTMFKKRGVWLVLLFIGQMFTANAMSHFEKEITVALVLALFVPMIISSGGNSGGQAASLIIRALAVGEVKMSDWWKVVRREIVTGLMLGAMLGALGFAQVLVRSWFSPEDYRGHGMLVAATITVSLMVIVLWGSITGSMLPIILKRLGLDPATSSTPFVATLCDVTGIVIYFAIAILMLRGALL
ncbi:MAG: magnesium transporter [Planctomycetes bacterium]|nr:magnesium transporter [Planctomycetota bacterium]